MRLGKAGERHLSAIRSEQLVRKIRGSHVLGLLAGVQFDSDYSGEDDASTLFSLR